MKSRIRIMIGFSIFIVTFAAGIWFYNARKSKDEGMEVRAIDQMTLKAEEDKKPEEGMQDENSGEGKKAGADHEAFVEDYMKKVLSHEGTYTSVEGLKHKSDFEKLNFFISFVNAQNSVSGMRLRLQKDATITGEIDTAIENVTPVIYCSDTEEYYEIACNEKFELQLKKGTWTIFYISELMTGSITLQLDSNDAMTVSSC